MERTRLLWTALLTNCVLTGISGAALLVAATALAAPLGLAGPAWLYGVGGLYLGVAALQALALKLRHRTLAGVLTAADWVYTTASVVVVAVWPQALSFAGKLAVLAVAAAVAVFATLQLVGLRRAAMPARP
jgi:hypothetical protein